MLVLTRKTMQSVQIGPDIKVVVLRLSDGTVRLGIDAPETVNIRRSELPVEKGKETKE